MNKADLVHILKDWNFWGNPNLNSGIDRPDYLEAYGKFRASDQIIIVTGARRTGKSMLMRQMARKHISPGADGRNTLIVNFEDPRVISSEAGILQKIYDAYRSEIYPETMGKPYIFLDEVQWVDGWERWVRSMHELGLAHICVTGSNASLLGRELASSLTGRHLDITVYPLSFKEFIDFKNVGSGGAAVSVETAFDEILRSGGFPEPFFASEKTAVLLAYYGDIINKDIVRRYSVRKKADIMRLASFYMTAVSSPVSFRGLERHTDLAANTIEKFSKYFSDAYLFFFLKRFSYKIRETEKSPRKIYCVDTGLANAVGLHFSRNIGRCAENMVFLELLRRGGADRSVFYWKDEINNEVDFVVKDGINKVKLIQVCWDVSQPETRKREVRALLKAMRKLKVAEGLVLTRDEESLQRHEEGKITFTPFHKWFLSGGDGVRS